MAEIEPADDEAISQWEMLARDVLENGTAERGLHINWMKFAAILARIRVEQERAEKAEAELDRLEAAIEEAANHDPQIADYIRAYTQRGENG